MKNHIDSEQHWEDSVNADYDYKKAMEKEQPDNRKQGQELPIHDVMPSAYLMNIDNEATIVEAENIAEAMDKAEATGSKDYEMVCSKSLPILH